MDVKLYIWVCAIVTVQMDLIQVRCTALIFPVHSEPLYLHLKTSPKLAVKKTQIKQTHLSQRCGFSYKKHVDYSKVLGYFRPRDKGQRCHLDHGHGGIKPWGAGTVTRLPLSQRTRLVEGNGYKMTEEKRISRRDTRKRRLLQPSSPPAWFPHSLATTFSCLWCSAKERK